MVSLIEAVILSIVQGITEWFPVSSSGHLALIHNYLGFQQIEYDIFLHFASILAVIILFRKDIIKKLNIKDRDNFNYFVFLLVGIIPAGIVGFFFRDFIIFFFSNMFYLGIFFILSGIIIYLTKFSYESKEKLSFFDSLFIGLMQVLALFPGISRSGTTISAGLFRGLKKEEAIRFSFYMAIPLIIGANIISFNGLNYSEINYLILITSFIITLLVSILTIKILLKIADKNKFYLFGIYNIILGILVLIYSYM